MVIREVSGMDRDLDPNPCSQDLLDQLCLMLTGLSLHGFDKVLIDFSRGLRMDCTDHNVFPKAEVFSCSGLLKTKDIVIKPV